jgi:D-alanine-D-alanine ligase
LIRLALIYGGASSEHSVSCVTALGVYSAIDKSKYEVIPIGITPAGKFVLNPISPDWKLADSPQVPDGVEVYPALGGGSWKTAAGQDLGVIDIAFPVLHGPNGEDGSIQGLLQLCEVPYVGNGVLASAVAMEKSKAKALFQNAGIAVAEGLVITEKEFDLDSQAFLEKCQAKFQLPVFVKPSRSGSSVGVSKVKSFADLESAIVEAFSHDNTVLVETAVVGREVECAVLELPTGELKVSLAGEIVVTGREFYDYEAKYLDGGADLLVPTSLSDSELTEMHRLAKLAFRALGCSGLARTDFFLTSTGFVITEVNTMPGFTPISMYPSLWQATGLSYSELVDTLIQTGLTQGTQPR